MLYRDRPRGAWPTRLMGTLVIGVPAAVGVLAVADIEPVAERVAVGGAVALLLGRMLIAVLVPPRFSQRRIYGPEAVKALDREARAVVRGRRGGPISIVRGAFHALGLVVRSIISLVVALALAGGSVWGVLALGGGWEEAAVLGGAALLYALLDIGFAGRRRQSVRIKYGPERYHAAAV